MRVRDVIPLGEVRVSHWGGDVWVVSLAGEHDFSNVSRLDRRLREVHAHGTRVVLDLSEASFIDTTVIASVVREARDAARKAGDDLAVVAPIGSQARRLLGIVQVEGIRIVESHDEALTAIGANPATGEPNSGMTGGGSGDGES